MPALHSAAHWSHVIVQAQNCSASIVLLLYASIRRYYHIQENFRVTLFSQILLSREIFSRHAFYVAHMDHSQKYFPQNY